MNQNFVRYLFVIGMVAGAQTARAADCNTNHTADAADIAAGAVDCNSNGTPDICDLIRGCAADCNTNGTLDICDQFTDCNTDNVPDACQALPTVGWPLVNHRDISGNSPFCAAAGDVNGDGLPDIVVGDGLTGIDLIINLGGGTFTSHLNILAAGDIRSIQLYDMDGDGDRDIVATDRSTFHIRTFLNNGAGTFTQTTAFGPFASTTPTDLVVGDIDGDGDFDLVFANEQGSTLLVAKNNGNATYAAPTSYTTAGVHTAEPGAMVLADLDNDGDLDVALTNNGLASVQIFRNNGAGLFAVPTNVTLTSLPHGIVAADVDCDGDLDLITANPQVFSIVRIRNDAGTFTSAVQFYAGNAAFYLAAGDFDADGDVDLVTTSTDVSFFGSFVRNFGGASGFFEYHSFIFNIGNGPITAVDLNGDSRLDLVTPNPRAQALTVLIAIPYLGQDHGDCNTNNTLDDCEASCNTNGTPDECEFDNDCNTNGTFDACDITVNGSTDCNFNEQPDECEFNDCNSNGSNDICEIAAGDEQDCNGDAIPDVCQPGDCNTNGSPDICEIYHNKGSTNDCNFNLTLDECELDGNDCNTNGRFDPCEFNDCDGNGTVNACDIANGQLPDLNCNGQSDDCEFGCYTCPGDVNGDYYVNGQDVQCFVNWMLAPHPFPQYICADMDSDGDVTAADVPLFVNRLLNGDPYCF